ncbi:MAG: LEA type 2 family protein [Woeseiaceae bacterium]
MATTYSRFQSAALAVVVLTLLTACVGMRPGFETPTVTVKSLRALPSEGALPDFEIVLNVLNPNNESLELSGVSYTVSLAGHDVVKGVGNDLPVIEGYGEADLTLTASANLFAGIGLIRDLMSSPNDNIPYEFEAKLDPGPLSPSIRIKDKGEISLNPGTAN